MTWLPIFDLKQDADGIESVQQATLTTKEYGIEPTHGLYGSTEWWCHIEDGTLPLHTLKGEIVRVYMGSMNDWPEFEMRAQDGSLHKFTRFVTPSRAELDQHYVAGRDVEVDYVWQDWRKEAPDWGLGKSTKVVTAVRIDV